MSDCGFIWSAVAERSDDTALVGESGVAPADAGFPPQSKTGVVFRPLW